MKFAIASPVTLTPKFIYFDLDDTLLDHRGAEKAALKDLCNRFDFLDAIDPEALIETYHQINKGLWERYGKGEIDRSVLQQKRFENTLENLGLDGSVYEEVGTFYMQAYRNHWRWIEGAFEGLHKVSNRYETGILTNGFAETQRKKFERFDLHKFARHLVVSEEVGYLKPQPEIFNHATTLTNREPEEILYIGDSYTSDIVGGSSFGWRTAWFTNGTSPEEDKSKADFVFDNFRELEKYLGVPEV